MLEETKKKLAGSLTAKTTELLPFLPYLLQDFWELGSSPNTMIELIKKHVSLSPATRILDLACGKGAVSVKVAQSLRVKVKGVDLLPEFLEYATQKARDYGVSDLCEFTPGDINNAVKTEKNYDCVILGAVGNVLGNPAETFDKLKSTVKPGGYILIDACYLSDNITKEDIKYNNYEYLTRKQWADLIKQMGLKLIEMKSDDNSDNPDSDEGMVLITARANELITAHPEKKDIFEGYIHSQQNEYDDIDNTLSGGTCILKK